MDIAQDWRSVAFATGAADRGRAEAGVRAAYAAAGLAGPARLLWAPSPAFGAVAALLLADPRHAAALRKAGLDDLVERAGAALDAVSAGPDPASTGVGAGRPVRDAVRTRPWEAARTAVQAELGAREWSAAWTRTGGALWEQVNGLVARIRQGLGELGDGTAEALLRQATLDAVLGQHDAPWLALFDAVGRLDTLAGLAETARTAGWWWPYERLAIICERPAELHRDEPGRLHRGDGPALRYPDGFALHAWRGMPIPPGFTATLAGLDVERIDAEENAELRRVMMEVFGYDRYLAESGAKPLHRDETGVLWRIDYSDDEPVTMVEVVNSTPEPDGTHRTYFLRVPPRTRTAREGVAWTFGVSAEEYQPVRQT
jgi:hypothetical protein